MGKNSINTIMKKMKENSPLQDVCPEKKITNHSARKTVVKKLKSSGVPKCEIKNITGHTSAQGLDDYDSGDELEQQLISGITDNSGPPQRSVLRQLNAPNSFPFAASCGSSQPVYNFSHCSVTLNIAGDHSAQKSSSSSGAKRPFDSE